jgi:ParB-like chromosome segregation protein Spo0J
MRETHAFKSRAQIKKLKESIEAFGFLNPILINSSGTIIAGHGRIQAAELLGMTEDSGSGPGLR